MENEKCIDKQTKKVFSRIGFAVAATMLIVSVVQGILSVILNLINPKIIANGWGTYLMLGISYYLIGMPCFYAMVKGLPDAPKKEVKKLSVGKVLMLFTITYGVMIICNLFTTLLMALVSIIKGGEVVNPLLEVVTNSNLLLTMIFVGILSPIVEEFMFRRIMLDKLRPYGDKIAMVTSAIMFGLFHGNFSQFFYATAIGLVLAYVVIKTGSIKYSIILHIMVNMMGSVIGLAAMRNSIATMIFGIAVWAIVIIGIVMFVKNRKKISLEPAEVVIEKGQVFKTTALNPGMIVYFIFMMVNMIIVLLMA